MSSSDQELVTQCYRTIREVTQRANDPKEVKALQTVCADLLKALGRADLVSEVFGSQGGFLFIPFL
jgi:hypothetical protein